MTKNLIKLQAAACRVLIAATLIAATVFTTNAQQIWEQQVTVNPKPTLTMPLNPVCQNTPITLTFTGTEPFTLNNTTNATGLPPSGSAFSTTESGNLKLTQSSGPDVVTGAYTYTAEIVAGAVGDFTFTGITLTDSKNCSNTIPDAAIKVYPLPTITLPNTPVCQGDYVDATLTGAVPWNLVYTVSPSAGLNLNPTITTSSYSIPAGDAGTYTFHLVSLTDNNGCAANPVADVTIRVKPTPDVTVSTTSHDLTLCAGDILTFTATDRQVVMSNGTPAQDITFNFTGDGPGIIMDYTLTANLSTTNTLSTAPPIPNPILIPTQAPFPPAVSVTIGDTPGSYHFEITSLASAGCTNTTFVDGYANLIVRPLPTVAFANTPICEGDNLTLTFTGSGTNPTFTLDYQYTQEPNMDVSTDLKLPSTIGLPDSFTPSIGTTDSNGVATYTQNIQPGTPGTFKFYLKSIDDGTCTNVNPSSPLW
jgi:hypothetical protein